MLHHPGKPLIRNTPISPVGAYSSFHAEDILLVGGLSCLFSFHEVRRRADIREEILLLQFAADAHWLPVCLCVCVQVIEDPSNRRLELRFRPADVFSKPTCTEPKDMQG